MDRGAWGQSTGLGRTPRCSQAGSQPRAISGAKSGPVIGLVVVQVAWEEDIGSRGVRNGNIPRPAHPLAS